MSFELFRQVVGGVVLIVVLSVVTYFIMKALHGRLLASMGAGSMMVVWVNKLWVNKHFLLSESEHLVWICAISSLITYFIARKISKANRERIRIRRLKRTRIERENAEREWHERESAERARRERESAERARRQQESAESEKYARKNSEILFRRAMQKIHPDRAPKHLQGMCQKLTAELNAARKADDYRKIREIAESVGVSLSDGE